MKRQTLLAVLNALAKGQSAKEIAARMKTIDNAQQIGAIITNVRRNVYDDEYPQLVQKILAYH